MSITNTTGAAAMTRDDIVRMAKEAHKDLVTVDYPGHAGQLDPWTLRLLERFAALVTAEKDKEIERLRADEKRLDWCISVLHRQDEKDSYLVTDAGCGCCGDGRRFDCSISGRDAIDAEIRARGEV